MKELRIEDLNCYRGSHLVLKRLNFSINSGETLLVRGDNGSGKTTLLRALSNYIRSYEGNIYFDELKTKEDHKYKNKFTFIGQKNSLKDNLSVKKNLKLWEFLYNRKISPIEILSEFNLSQLIDDDVSSLSDGQRKCISIQKLRFSESMLWFLDEPFVFLDEKNSKILMKKIEDFNKKNGIVIVTTNIDLGLKFQKEINLNV